MGVVTRFRGDRGDIIGLFRMQAWFASIPLVLYGASSPGASAASVERQATSLIDWHVYYCDGERERAAEREREREVQPAYTYLAYSMIGRRLITIEIGSRVAIPTRVTAPARASTCIIKFTVILIHGRPPPPPPPSSLFSLRAFRFPAVRANFPYLSARDGRKTKGISKGMENGSKRTCHVECISLANPRHGVASPFFSPKFSASRMFTRCVASDRAGTRRRERRFPVPARC